MSIYATLWSLKFPRGGDEYPGCEWIEVTAQAVPPHIGSPSPEEGYEEGDPYSEFLPPPVATGTDEPRVDEYRAVVIVTEDNRKGTRRSAQEYEDPLLVLAGAEYARASFDELHRLICDALRGDNPRVTSIFLHSDGRVTLTREDGTRHDVEAGNARDRS